MKTKYITREELIEEIMQHVEEGAPVIGWKIRHLRNHSTSTLSQAWEYNWRSRGVNELVHYGECDEEA